MEIRMSNEVIGKLDTKPYSTEEVLNDIDSQIDRISDVICQIEARTSFIRQSKPRDMPKETNDGSGTNLQIRLATVLDRLDATTDTLRHLNSEIIL